MYIYGRPSTPPPPAPRRAHRCPSPPSTAPRRGGRGHCGRCRRRRRRLGRALAATDCPPSIAPAHRRCRRRPSPCRGRRRCPPPTGWASPRRGRPCGGSVARVLHLAGRCRVPAAERRCCRTVTPPPVVCGGATTWSARGPRAAAVDNRPGAAPPAVCSTLSSPPGVVAPLHLPSLRPSAPSLSRRLSRRRRLATPHPRRCGCPAWRRTCPRGCGFPPQTSSRTTRRGHPPPVRDAPPHWCCSPHPRQASSPRW